MDKPLSFFLTNVVKNGSITPTQAATLNQLPTPHLQFEALMALKRENAPVHEVKELPVESWTWVFPHKRWVSIATVVLALPLLHKFWGHTPGLTKQANTFSAVAPIFITGLSAK